MSRNGVRAPITRTRSTWTRLDDLPMLGVVATVHERRVHDGTLRTIVGAEPAGLHMSISWRPNSPRQANRYPTWDEIADARDQFLSADRAFAMILPAAAEYVAVHDTTFHLHELPEEQVD